MIKIAELETTTGRPTGFQFIITDAFRKNVLEAIEATGETVPQVAEQIGMGKVTLYKILNGKTERMNRRTYNRLMTLSTWNTDQPQEAN